MPKSTKAALGLAAVALLAPAAPAAAAPPQIHYYGAQPMNARTTTPIEFFVGGSNPDDEGSPLTRAWDFAGGAAFQTLAEGTKHTFSTNAVHPVSFRVTDTEGESATGRFIYATHPDNWAPTAYVWDDDYAVTGEEVYLYANYSDDSPASGWVLGWELDGDGDFNDGTPLVPGNFGFVKTTFAQDGAHQVKFRIQDGQGLEAVKTATITTHTANEAPQLSLSGPTHVLKDSEFTVYAAAWDDFTPSHELVYEWWIDGVRQDGEGSSFINRTYASTGEHVFTVKVSEPGVGGLSREASHTVHVVDQIPAGEAALYVYRDGGYDHSTPTFRTLENAGVGVYVPGSGAVTYAWDLDNDGAFDDATGYDTYFAAMNKGTYRVAVQVTRAGQSPFVLHRNVVVDSGPDYAPKQEPVVTPPPSQQPPTQVPVILQQSPIGKVLQVIGSVMLSDGKVAGGKPGTTGQGVNLKAGSLFFGSVFSSAPVSVTVDYTVPLTSKGKVKASAAAKKKKAKVLKLGRSSVKLPGNASAPLKVKLSAKAKKALKKTKRVKVTARIKVKDLATGKTTNATKTIKLKVVKK